MQDVLTGEIIDPYQGREDISKGIIRCVDSSTFGNDPLPVYQAVQLASRFGFSISPETMALLRSVSVEDLPGKCIRAEYTKLLLESPEPSIGLELLRELHLLPPEVEALIGCPQNPRFHPEGDAWNHTMLVPDKAATLRQRSMDPEAFMWAALLHDVGKPLAVAAAGTTRDHASLGEKPAREALLRLTSEERFIDAVCRLVRLHMAPAPLYFADASDDEVKSLSMEVSLNEIMLLVEADFYGRPVPGLDEAFIPEHIWWQDRINRLGANVPAPR
jgi:tRNA nucleotidyltransferase (CCA-adding enzyme)